MAGVSEEDPHNVEDCGLEGAEAAKVSAGYLANYNAAFASIVANASWFLQTEEGPNENTVCLLADGKTLL